jgi:ABC-type uncharacterized transport system substrate-binding protein
MSKAGIIVLILIFSYSFFKCASPQFEKKRVVYINSYHRGHPSSDEIMDAVVDHFPSDSFNLKSYYMDTKRNPTTDYIQSISTQLTDTILLFDPDILIVSDDNAVKYIVQPNIDRLSMPVVFCGVNGSDKEYDLPPEKVTGMIEILPVEEAVKALHGYYPEMSKMLVLTENTTTSRKEQLMLDTLMSALGLSVSHTLADDFDEWKVAFKEANENEDLIYIVTHGAIRQWDHEAAVGFVHENTKVPVFTCEDFMMPYVVFGMTKVASEQGVWASETAKKILKGKSPGDFPVTRNQLSKGWLNRHLAEKIGFYPDSLLLNTLEIIDN